jgi:hypothetical protein
MWVVPKVGLNNIYICLFDNQLNYKRYSVQSKSKVEAS